MKKMSKVYVLNDNIKKLKIHHNKFQHTDFDNDLVGMFIELLAWLREINNQAKTLSVEFPKVETPESWYKFNPHFPTSNIRDNIRFALSDIFKIDENIGDCDEYVLLISHSAIFACAFFYQISPFKLEELMYNDEEVTRESVLQILLDEGMPSSFDRTPSDTDYTNLYL
jgi:hypothetical protein